MPMRLSALRIDDGTNTLGCLPLHRMPAPIRQRQSGSAFGMSMPVAKDSLTVIGPTKQFTRIADSGNEVAGVFCPECGVRIYHAANFVQDALAIKPGTLDDTGWLRPSSFIWMKSAQGWVPVPNGVKALEGQT